MVFFTILQVRFIIILGELLSKSYNFGLVHPQPWHSYTKHIAKEKIN